MDEQRYWSVRDAAWVRSPAVPDALATPWSWQERACRRAEPIPTPEQDLRWLPAVGRPQVPAQREAVSEAPARRT